MTAEPESIPRICAVCHATDDREPICNRGSDAAPYYLCIGRGACTDRATAQQHEAAEKVRNAVEAEREALEAGEDGPQPEGKHAATGPLQAIADAAVAKMTATAAMRAAARGTCSNPPAESCSDAECPVHGEPEWDSEDSNAYVAAQEAADADEDGEGQS